jgi:hypothetical protein
MSSVRLFSTRLFSRAILTVAVVYATSGLSMAQCPRCAQVMAERAQMLKALRERTLERKRVEREARIAKRDQLQRARVSMLDESESP